MFIHQKIDDPLFGKMILAPDESSYHGEVLFVPLKEKIQINVLSSSSRPTNKQHSLYKEIEQRYNEWIEKIPSFIENAFPQKGRLLSTFEFTKTFELQGIWIADLDKTIDTWEIEYATEGLDGLISIQFVNWEPSGFSFVQ